MRVFISSTPPELELYRRLAVDTARELGLRPFERDPAPRRGIDAVTACGRQVALADAMLAIVGWRRDAVPSVDDGGDGLRPWSHWQVKSAVEHGMPVVVLVAGETLRPEAREEAPEARAAVADLRGELARVATVFDDGADFRSGLRRRLSAADVAWRSPPSAPAGAEGKVPELRRYPPPELPPYPYPLLLPYSHPELMAGRDRDLADLQLLLDRPVTVVGLYAASGVGKSSLLAGGLVPALRAEGRPVALVRHPAEAGLGRRLFGDLVEGDLVGGDGAGVRDPRAFVDRLAAVYRLAGGAPPVLVIDQLEDLFQVAAGAARATLGTLLAASAQRLPGMAGPPCRWLLAYRQEVHGRLVEWLEDVLRDARDAGLEDTRGLPHDLSRPSRFAAWALRPLASPSPGAGDPVESAARVFLTAIEKPLGLRRPSPPAPVPGGTLPEAGRQKVYPWSFAPGDAERLARAFGEARVRQPSAPLAPELQVVLAHLLESAGEPTAGRQGIVEVPEDPAELIDRALEEHLRRALDAAFPRGQGTAGDEAVRIARTRALLVLRELADNEGRRGEGRDEGVLARALGEQGGEMLDQLSTPRTRLVLLEQHAGAQVYVLAHDRLAEVLVKVVDEGGWAGLGVDAELLALRRFVALQSQLHASGDTAQATLVPAGRFRGIEANRVVLLWTGPQRAWWRACRTRRRLERRRRRLRRLAAAVVAAAVALGAWKVANRRASRRALLQEVAAGEPEAAFAALDRLTIEGSLDRDTLRDRLRERNEPFDVFEHGLGGVAEERRAETLLRVAELALPILDASPKDPMSIASLTWALDFFAARRASSLGAATDPALAARATALREEVLRPLRRSRPPPPRPRTGDLEWSDIPAGSFCMGARSGEGFDDTFMRYSKPRHRVTVSAFRMLRHEVTNAEYRRLVPDHPGAADLPVAEVDWYRAYTYAAWLGGRLPTEAEWEYAARAGCSHPFCRRDGSEATLSEVAWWRDSSADPETGRPSLQPVMGLEPNPWGLWDMHGNAKEWNANWFGTYTEKAETDPPGPTDSSLDHRILRGGSALQNRERTSTSWRGVDAPHAAYSPYGLRVVLTIPGRAGPTPIAGQPESADPDTSP